jgi:Xylose isomerase-like TIM barrel
VFSWPHTVPERNSLLAVTPALLGTGAPADDAARARELDLALEVASIDAAELSTYGDARIATLQAWRLHTAHALLADARARAPGVLVLAGAIELAASRRIPRVLAVCGFGACEPQPAFERSVEQFRQSVASARSRGVRILIERLGARRTNAMLGADEHARLHAALDAPDVFGSALDTGHMLDAGEDPEGVLAEWPLPVEELQLRGRDGSAPGPSDPLERWIRACRARPAVVCIESKRPAASTPQLRALLARVRAELG